MRNYNLHLDFVEKGKTGEEINVDVIARSEATKQSLDFKGFEIASPSLAMTTFF